MKLSSRYTSNLLIINSMIKAIFSGAFLCFYMLTPTSIHGADFQGIGTSLGSTTSFAWGVSGDGQVIVGSSDEDAIRWESGTITTLGGIGCPIIEHSEAKAISNDGSTIVGTTCGKGFVWTSATGMEPIPKKIGQIDALTANAVSATGYLISGMDIVDDAFAWSAVDGIVSLGTLTGDYRAEANGVHWVPPFPPILPAGLATVVGTSSNTTTDHKFQAFTWNSRTAAIQGLGYLAGDSWSGANAISRDGSTVVGWSGPGFSGPTKPVRWVSGIIELIPGAPPADCQANAVSADGTVVVGGCGLGQAWIWDTVHGFRDLAVVLGNGFGINLSGWGLSKATGVSDDGKTIVGYALLNPMGNTEGWVANIAIDNDGQSDAQNIGAGQTSGSLATATPDGTDSCGGAGEPDIWYSYTAPVAGVLEVDTCGTHDLGGTDSGTDTILSLHSSDGGSEYSCNDDYVSGTPDPNRCSGVDAGFARDSYVQWEVAAGETVLIRVTKYLASPALRTQVNIGLDPFSDTDGDGIPDHLDNCTEAANPDQLDTDGDGYGNLCDGDLNDDGNTNTLDLNLYKQAHRTSIGDANYDPDADFNGDGVINTLDLNIYKGLHRLPPGPSCCGAF